MTEKGVSFVTPTQVNTLLTESKKNQRKWNQNWTEQQRQTKKVRVDLSLVSKEQNLTTDDASNEVSSPSPITITVPSPPQEKIHEQANNNNNNDDKQHKTYKGKDFIVYQCIQTKICNGREEKQPCYHKHTVIGDIKYPNYTFEALASCCNNKQIVCQPNLEFAWGPIPTPEKDKEMFEANTKEITKEMELYWSKMHPITHDHFDKLKIFPGEYIIIRYGTIIKLLSLIGICINESGIKEYIFVMTAPIPSIIAIEDDKIDLLFGNNILMRKTIAIPAIYAINFLKQLNVLWPFLHSSYGQINTKSTNTENVQKQMQPVPQKQIPQVSPVQFVADIVLTDAMNPANKITLKANRIVLAMHIRDMNIFTRDPQAPHTLSYCCNANIPIQYLKNVIQHYAWTHAVKDFDCKDLPSMVIYYEISKVFQIMRLQMSCEYWLYKYLDNSNVFLTRDYLVEMCMRGCINAKKLEEMCQAYIGWNILNENLYKTAMNYPQVVKGGISDHAIMVFMLKGKSDEPKWLKFPVSEELKHFLSYRENPKNDSNQN
jgi:hypothetical protein